jgi:hypothetical protein
MITRTSGGVGGVQPINWGVIVASCLLVTSGAFFVLSTPEELETELYPNFGWISGAAFGVSWPYWWFYAKVSRDEYFESLSSDFFTTAAQVLPVLALATVVDLRGASHVRRSQPAIYVLVIALGELSSIYATAFEHGRSATTFGLTCGALLGGFVGLLLAILTPSAAGSASR